MVDFTYIVIFELKSQIWSELSSSYRQQSKYLLVVGNIF